MRKKVFTMFLVGVMVLSLTACGTEENTEVVEDTVTESVMEDTQDVVEDTTVKEEIKVDESEVMDLTDTTIINLGETFGFNMELPVYTKAEIQTLDSGVAYIFTNKEGSKQLDRYTLKVVKKMNEQNSEKNGYGYIESWYTECCSGVEEDRYVSAQMVGDADSKYVISYYNGKISPNGDWNNVQDIYRVYNREAQIVLEIKLFVEKDATLYGDDILEKSTASYREQLRTAIENLANN